MLTQFEFLSESIDKALHASKSDPFLRGKQDAARPAKAASEAQSARLRVDKQTNLDAPHSSRQLATSCSHLLLFSFAEPAVLEAV